MNRRVALTWPGRATQSPPVAKRASRPVLRFDRADASRGNARLLCGDALANLDRLATEGERFHLIYIDPPFGSEAAYARRRKLREGTDTADIRLPAYGDIDGGDVAGYLDALYPVLCRAHELLHDDGSLYLHIDHRRGPHLRLLLDEIFGADALLNELVWAYALGGSSRTRFQRKHDTIHFYAKNPGRHYFDAPREEATSSMLAGKPKQATDTWVTADRDDATTIDRDWPDELLRKTMSNRDPERTGYGTQKPFAVIGRIVTASCPPGGRVLDPMCGSGTLGVAAVRLGRDAVVSDRGQAAVDVARARFLNAGAGLTVEAVDDGPVPSSWSGQESPVLIADGHAVLNEAALREFIAKKAADGMDTKLAALLEKAPHRVIGAWGVGRRRSDGGVAIQAWSDQAHRREPAPVQTALPASGVDAWWMVDVFANAYVG